jgi:hypothetical protein
MAKLRAKVAQLTFLRESTTLSLIGKRINKGTDSTKATAYVTITLTIGLTVGEMAFWKTWYRTVEMTTTPNEM